MKNFSELLEQLESVKTRSTQQVAEKHKVPISQIKRQLNMGIEVEQKHTKNLAAARQIALDHLWERPDYYTKLKKAKL